MEQFDDRSRTDALIMNPGKSSNLFEAIRNGRRGHNEPQIRVPGWWNAPRNDATGSVSPADRPPDRSVSMMAWLAAPSRMAMPRALWIIVLAALVGIPILTYRMGGTGSSSSLNEADRQSQQKMGALRREAINPQPLGELRTNRAAAADPTQPRPTSSANPADPRTPDLNYFCLETMPARYRDQAERAVEFLGRNGVDAAIIPVNNSRIQLVALKGFKEPYRNPQAQEYRNLLRSLGRAWKLEHKGWSDWSDTYPAKYTGT